MSDPLAGQPPGRPALAAILALAVLAACAAPPAAILAPNDPFPGKSVLAAYPRLAPSRGLRVAEATGTGAERAYVTAILADLQQRSFAENREYCGYFGFDASGAYATTPINAGTEASCPLPRIPPGLTLVASFHTHGTYSPYYASEWPTTQDMATDAADSIDGYIATPGGRLWYVDTDTMTVREICGRGCLPQDRNYVAADDGPLHPLMSYAQLTAWERS